MVDQQTFMEAIKWFKRHFSEYGTKDYQELLDKPTINGEVVEGNKTSEDYHIEGGVTITGLAMRVNGTNVEFYHAEDPDDIIRATLVQDTNIIFVR